jgi:hypothetical protein
MMSKGRILLTVNCLMVTVLLLHRIWGMEVVNICIKFACIGCQTSISPINQQLSVLIICICSYRRLTSKQFPVNLGS